LDTLGDTADLGPLDYFSFRSLLRVHFIVDLVNVFWVANPIWVAKNWILMSPLFTQPTFIPVKTQEWRHFPTTPG
jgi:hypothetical protein